MFFVPCSRDFVDRSCSQAKTTRNQISALPSFLRTDLMTVIFLVVGSLIALTSAFAQSQTHPPTPPEQRTRYQIQLAIDYDQRTYFGTERVRWVNRGDHATSTLFFHLYPNVRMQGYVPPAGKTSEGQTTSDEPRLDISEVGIVGSKAPLQFVLDEQETTLRLNLHDAIAPNAAVELELKFHGSIPEIDPEETGLMSHLVQQVSAAIRSSREVRRARDTNFRCRGVIMLGSSYPVLAARDGDDWFRKVESTIGDSSTTDAADYEVTIEAPREVEVFAPVKAKTVTEKDQTRTSSFVAEDLRDFAIIAGDNLRAEEKLVGDVTVRSIFRPDHEATGRRVLKIAAASQGLFAARFGPLPLKTVSIVDAPLVATLGSAEFAGLSAVASAFYLDFDSPTMRNMPDVVREQRTAVEDSLEWTIAHGVAHQWWGATVGNDSGRQPVLDEALANWSAFLYYRETHTEAESKAALDEQVRGVYTLYRTFGGEDMEANRSSREYRNSFQYSAIVASKGALMFEALRRLLGDERFFAALRDYYSANALEVAGLDDLRGAFVAGAPVEQRRAVSRTFDRWLASKRGDEDIGPPDPKLAAELGLPARPVAKGDRTVFTAFAKVGKFFWQQMTRIR
jgi:hypothetical protein